MSLTIRAVTGTVVLPSGTNVTSGEVIFKLYGTPPADSDQMATQGTIRMAITNGAISGNIIAPANYHITIISSDGSFYAFSAAVNETSPSDPLTLQANVAALQATHRIAEAAVFDQFPYTHHLECGLLLTRR